MPFVEKPRSDEERLTWLRRLAQTGRQDEAEGKQYLPATLLADLEALAAQMEAGIQAVDGALAGRVRETAERRAALEALAVHVRDYWQGLVRRTQRLGHSVEVLRQHGLPVEGLLPNPGPREEWIVWAQRIVAGDAAAVAAGLPPMCNPTSAQVAAVLATAQAEAADLPAADRAYDEAQAALADLRLQADDLIDLALGHLGISLRKLDAPSQRRIMRTYGVVYGYYEGEEPDPEL